jgi:hypothetical protein
MVDSPVRALTTIMKPLSTKGSIGRRRKINVSTALAGENVGVKQLGERIWLVSFMQYDFGLVRR